MAKEVMQLPTQVLFASEKIKKQFENLEEGKEEEKRLHAKLEEIFESLEKNAFAGIQIPKKLIPKTYFQQYQIKNLWKYNLPGGWRLLYSVENREGFVVSRIVEWLSHKDYEKRLNYR